MTALRYQKAFAIEIIIVTAILHNMCMFDGSKLKQSEVAPKPVGPVPSLDKEWNGPIAMGDDADELVRGGEVRAALMQFMEERHMQQPLD